MKKEKFIAILFIAIVATGMVYNKYFLIKPNKPYWKHTCVISSVKEKEMSTKVNGVFVFEKQDVRECYARAWACIVPEGSKSIKCPILNEQEVK